jgi:pyrimidine 5'-nucleotidase
MRYTCLFFDLDDTLYSSANGLWNAIKARMAHYIYERVDVPHEQIPALRRQYVEAYGTTLRGLQIHNQVDTDDFLAYVHDLPLEEYLRPDPALRSLLLGLPQKKWIFTNADEPHARRVLSVLGVEDCFCGVIDVRATGFACKPEAEAYRLALHLAGESEPRCSVLFDDSERNLAPARRMGFTTVLVGQAAAHSEAVSIQIGSLLDLPQAMPELWDERS